MAATPMNLNEFRLDNDGNFSGPTYDNSVTSDSGVSVYFRGLADHLIRHIQGADAVFGAVAWLTNDRLLDALAKVNHVSMIVQKEDFLRPDLHAGDREAWKQNLHAAYGRLHNDLNRFEFDNALGDASQLSDPSIDPVRCVGNHNRDKLPAFPRMHNKFLVLATVETVMEDEYNGHNVITPYGVWTGSFNFTENSVQSLENALYITDPAVVAAYWKEYGLIAAMSEPLDWTSDWMEPEWRIGT